MTRAALPPIFAKARFIIGSAHAPAVVFRVTRSMDEEAERIVGQADSADTRVDHFGRWWVEYDHLGILATLTDSTTYTLQAWGRKSGMRPAFSVSNDDFWSEDYARFTDDQKIIAALYMRAAILLGSYIDTPADVSVNTGTRHGPVAWERQGDTLRYVDLADLRSASGLIRDYTRPAEVSGIRMREHDVRGHWRTFTTGVRVWVRSHKRGDPAIGRAQRIITGGEG